jgi:hypothetical protein
MPTPPELRMSFADRAALALELESNLKHGRAFVKDAEGIEALTDCSLRIVHPEDGAELSLRAQAVLVCESGPMRGIGVQLRPFDSSVAAQLDAFVAGVRPEPAPVATDGLDASAAASGEAASTSVTEGSAPDAASAAADPEPDLADRENEDDHDDDALVGDEEENAADDDPSLPVDQQKQPARHERLRKLSLTDQQKIARTGDLNDRVTLERIYGKHVWEGLLHNPKLTVPEVARIARKGTMPRPLLEFIVDNNAWIQAAIVRRALLGNPRVSGEAIMKLLRITPKHELRAIYKTTTYSTQVREAARKVLDM